METKTEMTSSYTARYERAKKGRLYVHLKDATDYPTGPICSTEGCECGNREVDHKVWKNYRRAEISRMRTAVEQAVEAGQLVPSILQHGMLNYSSKAGCSCGCSPGFIVNHGGYWNQTVNVSEVDTEAEKREEEARKAQKEAAQRGAEIVASAFQSIWAG